jgi:hypothetical protein
MIKRILLLLLFTTGAAIAQDSLKVVKKDNPIFFYEGYVGFGGGKSAGYTIGATVNYQFFKTDLLTVRIATFLSYTTEAAYLAPIIVFPVFERSEQITEYGLLYGKRWIAGGTSFSISAGVSVINHEYLQKINDDYFYREQNLMGIPFEMNVKFFKSQKRRLRLYYGIIPVTKKRVAFGRSIGFKFAGNIGKANYTSLGISYGFGVHKKY